MRVPKTLPDRLLSFLPEATTDMEWYVILLIVIGSVLTVSVALWLFLIGTQSKKGCPTLKNYKYAHRGLHGEGRGVFAGEPYAAENSMTAFRRAIRAGYGIEIDVHTSKDGIVVIHHDASLKRVAGVDGNVKDFTAEELSRLSLSGTADGVPTLKEFLSEVNGQVPILIEIKEEGSDHTITEALLREMSGYTGEYFIQSFNPLSLGVVKKLAPKIPRGFLCDKHTQDPKYRSFKYRLLQRLLLNAVCRPHFISMEMTRAGLFPLPIVKKLFSPEVICWTVRSEDEAKRAYESGFATIIFEGFNA